MTEPVLAIDIGGTKIAAALVTADGTIQASHAVPTHAVVAGMPRSAAELYDNVTQLVRTLVEEHELPQHPRVGVSSAGPIDITTGTISPVNIPGWRQFDLVAQLRRTLTGLGHSPASIRLIGDGHCVALGEWWLGAGQNQQSVIGCIVSTGVGAGTIIDGVPFEGPTGSAMHLGHISVKYDGELCVCGSRGCVESIASGTSMVRRARSLGWSGSDAIDLTAAARRGDEIALQIIDEGMQALGAGLAAMATIFDISTIIVGGGVSKAGAVIFDPLEKHFHSFATMPYLEHRAEIRAASLENASLMGAAKVALDAVTY